MSSVEHIGTVEKIEGRTAQVLIEQQTACASCHAKGFCNPAEKGRDILVKGAIPQGMVVEVGERVKLVISQKRGLRAVALVYIIPVVISVLTLAVLISYGVAENISALISLLVVAVNFIILFTFERKKGDKTEILIEKIL